MSRLYTFGAGEDGQLGIGTQSDEYNIQGVDLLNQLDVVSIAAGSRNSLAITSSGEVYAWGWNKRCTLGHAPRKCGMFQPLNKNPGAKILHEYCCIEPAPVKVNFPLGVKIVQAAIGGWHCLALDDQGSVYSWGGNEYGQCGIKLETNFFGQNLSHKDIHPPQKCIPDIKVKQVAAGGTHSVILSEEGEVWTWGQPWPPGQINEIWKPVCVPGLKNVKSIAVGAFHNLALCSNGQVFSFGTNEYGQLGTGDTQPRALPELIPQLTELDVVDICAGGWHSMAITSSGEVYGWGRGEHGRLGFGDDKSSKTIPQKIQLLAHETIVQVSCGGTHSLAITKDGRIYSFGRGLNGRLGYDCSSTSGHPFPLDFPESYYSYGKVSSTMRFVSVACGGRHNLLLASSGMPKIMHPWHKAQLLSPYEVSMEKPTTLDVKEGELKAPKHISDELTLSIKSGTNYDSVLQFNDIDSPVCSWVNGNNKIAQSDQNGQVDNNLYLSEKAGLQYSGCELKDARFVNGVEDIAFILEKNMSLDVKCN